MRGNKTSDANARRFYRKDLVDAAIAEKSVKFPSQLADKSYVYLVIYKAVYLQHVSLEDFSVAAYSVLKKFHICLRLTLSDPLKI